METKVEYVGKGPIATCPMCPHAERESLLALARHILVKHPESPAADEVARKLDGVQELVRKLARQG